MLSPGCSQVLGSAYFHGLGWTSLPSLAFNLPVSQDFGFAFFCHTVVTEKHRCSGGWVRCGSTTECIRRKSLNTKNKSTLDGLKPTRPELVTYKVGTKLGMGQKTQTKGCSVKRLHTEPQAQRCAKINMCLKLKIQLQPPRGPCEPEKSTQSCLWAWRWCQTTRPRKKPKNLSPAGTENRTGSWTLGHRL